MSKSLDSSARSKLRTLAALVTLGLTASGSPASAQMSRSALEKLNAVHPPHPFNDIKNFSDFNGTNWWDSQDLQGYAVNYGNQNADDPKNVAYVWYAAPAGSVLQVSPYFSDYIPDPTPTTDACHHAHLEFAVYRSGYAYVTYWPSPIFDLFSSTGELGRRIDINTGNEVFDETPGARCVVTSAPDNLYSSLAFYHWGSDIVNVPIRTEGNRAYDNVFVALQAVSHGWGSCGNFLCFQGVGLVTFRTQ